VKLFFLILCLPFLTSKASYPDFFGASATSYALGGQASLIAKDAGNNFYAPAVLAFSRKLQLNLETSATSHELEPITGVVTKNSTNSSAASLPQNSNVSTDYKNYYGTSFNLSVPVAVKGAGSIGLSLFMPLGKITEAHTGDAYLPEYVMYRARYKRVQSFLNYAHPLTESFAFSLGVQIGFKIASAANTQVSLTGTGYGSSGKIEAEAAPTLAGIFSLAYKPNNEQIIYFSYQQEMKSEMEAYITGQTSDPPVPLDITATSLLYYDPHIFRTGMSLPLSAGFNLLGSLEYQLWENYESPVLRLKQNQGSSAVGSDNRESLSLKNIFVPRLGLRLGVSDETTLNLGASYRQSPLDGDFSGAGNSIDTDVFTLAAGMSQTLAFIMKDLSMTIAAGYHQLKELKVTKSPNKEDGTTGVKIGSPGYTIGGKIYSLKVGLNATF
jgi:hypothetical protein